MHQEQLPEELQTKILDPEFRAKLVADPVKYGREIGIDTALDGVSFVVKKNTADTLYMPVHKGEFGDAGPSVSEEDLLKMSAAGCTGTLGCVGCASSLGSACGTASTGSSMSTLGTLGST